MRWALLANFGAQIWAVVLGVAFVPVFIHLLGPEGYGLVGFAASLQAVLAVLDLGLATTANRELSRASARDATSESRVLLRTLEVAYIGMGVAIALVLLLAVPSIAVHGLRPEAMSRGAITTCLTLLALTIGLRWPVGLYTGVLRGLERQVAVSGMVAVGSTLRTAGAALALVVLGPSVTIYFACLLAVGVLEVLWYAWLAWRSLPRDARAARIELAVLRRLWRFSGTVTAVSLFATVLKQMDKIVIARLQPLAALGYYNAATMLSSGLLLVAVPVFATVFPRFTALLARDDERGLAALYHRSSSLVAMLGSPVAAALVFFPDTLLRAWTRSAEGASLGAGALGFLAFAMLLNSCMQVPYALQLAAGLTRISLWLNGIGLVVLVPLLVILVRTYGIVGGGMAWAIFNAGYFVASPILLHRKVLRGHLAQWFVRDTGPYLLLALLCLGSTRWLAQDTSSETARLLLMAGGLALYTAILADRVIRAAGTPAAIPIFHTGRQRE